MNIEELLTIDPTAADRTQVETAVIAWRSARATRLEQDKVAAKLKGAENSINEWIIATMRSQAFEGIVIGGRFTTVVEKEQPICSDRSALSDYILRTGELDLLQFRLSVSALAERQAAGEQIPGVELMPVYTLSDKKA